MLSGTLSKYQTGSSEYVCVYRLTKSKGHMETGPRFEVLSDRLGEPGIELGTPGYKASGISTTLLQLLIWVKTVCKGYQTKVAISKEWNFDFFSLQGNQFCRLL